MEYVIPARPWYRPRLRTLLLYALIAFAATSLYSSWLESAELAAQRAREQLAPSVGSQCLIELRSAPGVAPVQGRFRSWNDQWVVLDGVTADAPQQWVPRDQIRRLEVSP